MAERDKVFIHPEIDGLTQEEINTRFSDNFEIIENLIQAPSEIKTMPPNEYGNVFVRAGVVMDVPVDVDYDKPDIEKCRKIVLDDFSSKILTLFRETPFEMRDTSPSCRIYSKFDKRWFRYYKTLSGCHECKHLFKLVNNGASNEIAKYVQEYIKDYMDHVYIGRGVAVPTVDEVRNWCGGGEFPFLETYLIKHCDEKPLLCYYLQR